MFHETEHEYDSLDGLRLSGTLLEPNEGRKPGVVAVLVHGITADRDEGGFYSDLAKMLAARGIPSLRFDLRSHGRSEGAQEDLTIFGGVSDIAASCEWVTRFLGPIDKIGLIAASFGGGLATLYASKHAPDVLVLFNPNLNYFENWLMKTPNWDKTMLSRYAVEKLRGDGSILRGEFHLSREMVNEVIHVRPADVMKEISCPTLTVHGTADTLVSFETARVNYRTAAESKFVELAGADHGFIEPGDEALASPRTREFRDRAIAEALAWVTEVLV